jgi:hypothetical protein
LPEQFERADADAVRIEAGAKLAPRLGALEHAVEVQMRRRGPIAAAEFQHVHLEARGDLQHRVEIGLWQAVGDHPDFHGALERKENERRNGEAETVAHRAAATHACRSIGCTEA